jgi:hypothetical protein
MKLVAIIATLVLGVTAASAQPPVYRGDYDQHDERVGPIWVRLSPSLPSFRERQEIFVAQNAGFFRTVKVTADAGNLLVKRVNVRFHNGKVQQVTLNRFVRAGEVVNIPLVNGVHQISKIVVITERGPGWRTNGRFSVYGSRPQQYGYNWRDRRYPARRY